MAIVIAMALVAAMPSVVAMDLPPSLMETVMVTDPKNTPAPVQPVPCCGKYETCTQACTPRGKFLAKREAQAAPTVQEPIAFEVGLVEWVGNKLMATPKVTTTPPASWMEMVVANLVREGVNKHKARELAEHFYSLAQRQWVGLTDEDKLHIEIMGGKSDVMLAEMVEAKLKEKNT